MVKITAQMVKELREMTGAGMMECKKALTEKDTGFNLKIINHTTGIAIQAVLRRCLNTIILQLFWGFTIFSAATII